MSAFVPDPNGPPSPDSGLYGLDPVREAARAIVFPVPFEATVSYRAGTRSGPEAIRLASHQVDLLDADVGNAAHAGIYLHEALAGVEEASERCRPLAEQAIEAQASGQAPKPEDIQRIDAAGEAVRDTVFHHVTRALTDGQLPVVLGGDHSVPLGAIEAVAQFVGEDATMGILHLDAHADLRVRYEGFAHSHASIMHNVLSRTENVVLVQVGIRDFSDEEVAVIQSDSRITTFFDAQLRAYRLHGKTMAALDAVVGTLPQNVYLSFDIDGLDPTLCPHTGTPVPGGLSYDEVVELLKKVVDSGRRIIGMDLVEVAPGPDADDEWDALVAARLLYKMIGFALQSRGELPLGTPIPWPTGFAGIS